MIDWLFRNRETGEITIAQFPNAALWLFIAVVVLRWFVPTDHDLRPLLDWIGVGALGWWSVDEIVRGVNPWRRILGSGALCLTLASAIELIR